MSPFWEWVFAISGVAFGICGIIYGEDARRKQKTAESANEELRKKIEEVRLRDFGMAINIATIAHGAMAHLEMAQIAMGNTKSDVLSQLSPDIIMFMGKTWSTLDDTMRLCADNLVSQYKTLLGLNLQHYKDQGLIHGQLMLAIDQRMLIPILESIEIIQPQEGSLAQYKIIAVVRAKNIKRPIEIALLATNGKLYLQGRPKLIGKDLFQFDICVGDPDSKGDYTLTAFTSDVDFRADSKGLRIVDTLPKDGVQSSSIRIRRE